MIAIVNICFKKGGTERRDNAQQNSASERNFWQGNAWREAKKKPPQGGSVNAYIRKGLFAFNRQRHALAAADA
ncbi:hypothetical protein DDJ70_01295 [Klebsiella michiganensis]|uniref:Uncharacterized protein n=1 Tax=Klebsiella michiganensis TaxID=1134687 RepID=A0A2J4Z473_9ENTR|nr:hypothetical protein CWM85_19495 [Klebsiella michiganensis]RFC14102.1 hypothetical protein DDJ70_01295 [Klebsiella michiganensis]